MDAEIRVQAVQEVMATEEGPWGAVPEPSSLLAR